MTRRNRAVGIAQKVAIALRLMLGPETYAAHPDVGQFHRVRRTTRVHPRPLTIALAAVGCNALAIAPVAGMDGTDGNEVVISDRANIVRTNRDQRLGPARGRDELHADRIGTVDLDDRAQVAPAQAMSRQVAGQHDGIERVDGHFWPPG